MLTSSFNQSEVLHNKIQLILKESIFILSNSKNNLKCFFNTENNNSLIYYKDDLISLRERAQMSKKKNKDYIYFIEQISNILNISNKLKEILNLGYPKDIELKIEMKHDEKNIDIFLCKRQRFRDK